MMSCKDFNIEHCKACQKYLYVYCAIAWWISSIESAEVQYLKDLIIEFVIKDDCRWSDVSKEIYLIAALNHINNKEIIDFVNKIILLK